MQSVIALRPHGRSQLGNEIAHLVGVRHQHQLGLFRFDKPCWSGSRLAVAYVIRVKVPSGAKLMPHKHPEDRINTVMSGVFYIGLGEQFDGDK